MAGSSSRIGFGRAGGGINPSSTDGFQAIGTAGMDTSLQRQNVEAYAQMKTRSAGTVCSQLGINITTNTIATSLSAVLRRAGADGNNAVSVAPGTTGWFEDATHSDTLADGDLLAVRINSGTTLASITCRGGACTLTTPSAGAHMYFMHLGESGGPPWLFQNAGASTTWFMALGGQTTQVNDEGETSETNYSKTTLRAAGTISNLQTAVSTNSRGTNSTFKLRVNGADGAQAISISPASSGLLEDTTHTDAVAAGQAANYAFTNGTGGGNLNTFSRTVKFASSDGKSDLIAAASSTAASCTNAVTYYGPLGLYHTANSETVEANAQSNCPYPARFTNLRCACTTYALGSPVTLSFRNNAAAGNQSVSINGTGVFEDTTHGDSLLGGNKFCYSLTSPGGTSGIVAPWFASTQQSAHPPARFRIIQSR